MTIETKYSIGDTFWVLNPRTLLTESHKIASIDARVEVIPGDNYSSVNRSSIFYKCYGGSVTVEESKIFTTKEALLASL